MPSHEEFITVDFLDVGSGREGVGGLQGVRQHGASRRGRNNAFLVPFLQIWWEERKETGGVRRQGWSCQGPGDARCFPVAGNHVPLHQLVDEQLDPGRLRGNAHPPVLLQGEAARPRDPSAPRTSLPQSFSNPQGRPLCSLGKDTNPGQQRHGILGP